MRTMTKYDKAQTACAYAVDLLRRNAREHEAFLTDYLSAKEQRAIHVALVANNPAYKAVILKELSLHADGDDEAAEPGEFIIETISESDVIGGLERKKLDDADAVICCIKEAAPEELPLDAFCAVWQVETLQQKVLLCVVGFDKRCDGANGVKWLDYWADIEETLGDRGIDCSGKLFVPSAFANPCCGLLADALDTIINKKSQNQIEVLRAYIEKYLNECNDSRNSADRKQEQSEKNRLMSAVIAECDKACKRLEEAEKTALSKLNRRFVANKLKVREIIAQTQRDTIEVLTGILKNYLTAQEANWALSDGELTDDPAHLCFDAGISEGDLKRKRRAKMRISARGAKGGLHTASKTVEVVEKAAEPVKIGKKFSLRKFRFEDIMSNPGGSGTALHTSLSKVLGEKCGGSVSEKLGAIMPDLKKYAGWMGSGWKWVVAGVIDLSCLIQDDINDFQDKKKREELKQKIAERLKEHFGIFRSRLKADAQAREKEIQDSFIIGGNREDCALLDKSLRELSRLLENS